MDGDAHQAAQRTLAGHQGQHRVFHAAIASLNHVVFRVHVGSNVVVDEGHGPCRVVPKGGPIAVQLWACLVDQTKGHTVHIEGLRDKIRVGRPSEVNDIVGFEPHDGARCAVGHGLVRGRLLDPCGGNHIALGHVKPYIVVAPDAVEFAADVGVAVPTVVVKFAKLGVPLGHAVLHALRVHPTGSADLTWHLGLPCQVKSHGLSRAELFGQVHHEDGAVFFKRDIFSLDLDRLHPLPTPLVFGKLRDAAAHPTVRI